MPRTRSLTTTTGLLPDPTRRSGSGLPAYEDELGVAARRPERLSLSEVLVAAGTAVLGVCFGPAGTAAGAALGSVASTLAARTVHQRTPARPEAGRSSTSE